VTVTESCALGACDTLTDMVPDAVPAVIVCGKVPNERLGCVAGHR